MSLIGMMLALIARASGGSYTRKDGVLEVTGGWPAKLLRRGFPFCGPAAAITIGHVVLGASQDALDKTRSHERVHVGQYERWGILFVLAYPLAGAWAWIKGGNPYWDNVFERQARELE
ncbi:MAG: hypothetical protein ACYC4K_00445 [Thiobacillus sp.]